MNWQRQLRIRGEGGCLTYSAFHDPGLASIVSGVAAFRNGPTFPTKSCNTTIIKSLRMNILLFEEEKEYTHSWFFFCMKEKHIFKNEGKERKHENKRTR